MSRWKAASLHLLLSAALIGTIVGITLWLWYPLSLLHVSGVDRLIGLIASVDLTAGPLLTLIVYKHGKRGLKLDLFLIGLVQFGLLFYGISVLAQNRPVFMVASVDRIEIVTAKDIRPEDLAKAKPPYDRLSWTGADLVGAQLPRDKPDEMTDIMFGREVHLLPRYYVPYEAVRAEILERSKTLDSLLKRASPAHQKELLEGLGVQSRDQARYVPLNSGDGSATMLMTPTAEPTNVVPVDPWAPDVNE